MSTPKLVNFPHGSNFQSVNTKTSQFSPFFGFQEFEKNMSTPKLVNFHHFFGFQELRKKHVNTKASQFSTYFGFQKFEKNMSTPKLVNFPNFLTCTSLRKTCQHQKFEKKHVNTKTSKVSPFFDLHKFEKNMSTPKVWEKTCQNQN